MSRAPIVSHDVVNKPSAVAPVVSRARNAMIVPRNWSGKTNATRISPAFLTSGGGTSSIPSAPSRNMPMPNAKKPRGSPLPIGRTKIRVIGGICWPEPFEAIEEASPRGRMANVRRRLLVPLVRRDLLVRAALRACGGHVLTAALELLLRLLRRRLLLDPLLRLAWLGHGRFLPRRPCG